MEQNYLTFHPESQPSTNTNEAHPNYPMPVDAPSGGFGQFTGAAGAAGSSLNSFAPDQPETHIVSLTRAPTTGKVLNNPSVPHMQLDQRDTDRSTGPTPLATYIRPVKNQTMRSTFRVLPTNSQLADSVSFPFGAVVRPLADEDIPLVDFSAIGENKVVRCKRCKAYINPYCSFVDGGRRWNCILCKSFNDVPQNYFSPLDPQTGLRQDVQSRPELICASCEFVAPVEYMVRPPQRPTFVFLLDVSYVSIQTGMLRAMCEGLLGAIEQLKDDDSLYVSFVAFDTTIYLFNLRSGLNAPKMIVAPDLVKDVVAINEHAVLDPVELPALSEDLIVPLRDSHQLIVQLLEKLPDLFAKNSAVQCAFGPALTVAISMLQPTGGKIVATLCSIPSVRDGALVSRCDPKLFNQPKEYTLCAPAVDWYKQRSLACSHAQISVDVLSNSASEVDLATVSPISRYTSGHIYRFDVNCLDGVRRQAERILLRNTGFEAVLRFRTMKGISISNFYGHCYVRGPDLLTLPCTDSDTCYSFQMQLSEPLQCPVAFVQIALLYTTRGRERRIRVHTVGYPISSSVPKIFNSADGSALLSLMSKMCIDFCDSNTFAASQQRVNDKMITGLRGFKRVVQSAGTTLKSSHQLFLPERMKFLPQCLSGFFRSPAVRCISIAETMPDDRIASMSMWMTAPPDALLSYCLGWTFTIFTPRCPLNALPQFSMPTVESLHQETIALVDCGSILALWIGKMVSSDVLSEFGIRRSGDESAYSTDSSLYDSGEMSELVFRYRELVSRLQSSSNSAQHSSLVVIFQGSPQEKELLLKLIDDDLKDALSLGSYLAVLHKKVTEDK